MLKKNITPAAGLLLMAVVMTCIGVVVYMQNLQRVPGFPPRDVAGLAIGRDYVNFWLYGQALDAQAPQLDYDSQYYNEKVNRLFGANYPEINWSYPPPVMLLAYPFSRLAYLPSLICFMAFSIGLLVWSMRRLGLDGQSIALLLVSPASYFCWTSGQTTYFTTALMVLALSSMRTGKTTAGACIGMLLVKPQLGMVWPFFLAASRQWKIFLAATCTVALLIAASYVWIGHSAWAAYFERSMPRQLAIMSDAGNFKFMPTLYSMMRQAAFDQGTAMVVTMMGIMLALTASVIAGNAWRKGSCHPLPYITLLVTVCGATGYLMFYDTLPLALAAILLLRKRSCGRVDILLAHGLYWLPLFHWLVANVTISIIPAIVPVALAWLVYRLQRRTESAVTACVPHDPQH